PGLAVEPGVLLEVGDLLAGGSAGVALGFDPLPRLRRALIDVDLVAEQEEQLRPLLSVIPGHLVGEHVEGVELPSLLVFVLAEHVGLLVGRRDAAGAEADVDGLSRAEGPDRARRKLRPLLGPAPLPIQLDVVLVEPPGLEALDPDQRIVVSADAEGPLSV